MTIPNGVRVVLIVAASGGFVAADPPPSIAPVQCEGAYPRHLQGVAVDERGDLYWSFTVALVKTDRSGRVLRRANVANHHGDLCVRDGKAYVAVNLGEFNRPAGRADSWVYVYDAGTLEEVARCKTPEVVHGAGGIACRDGRFFVVGGLPVGARENYVYEYDEDFAFQGRRVLASGYTALGIQTAEFANGCWWFGCYGNPRVLLKVDPSFERIDRFEFDAALGLAGLPDGRFLVGRGACSGGSGCTGRVVLAVDAGDFGLKLVDSAENKEQTRPPAPQGPLKKNPAENDPSGSRRLAG
jgi:hypothetical protein